MADWKSARCIGLDPFGDPDVMLSACSTCSLTAACQQLAADHGETAGVWGGLDLEVDRHLLPSPTPPEPSPPAPAPRRVGRPDWLEGCGLPPEAVSHGRHTSAMVAEY